MAKDMYQKRKERKEAKVNNGESLHKTSINWYPGHMAKTKRLILEKINLIDVVYEVIDARIPKSSKIIDIDEVIKNKPRILIMTKYDLCDKNETKRWVKYYEELGYKVLTLDVNNDNLNIIIQTTNEIMEEINNKRINKGLSKRKARALIVGVPNVGKSTLINRLVGKKALETGNKPGVTKILNWVRINENIELLDSPGILWPKFDETTAYNLAALTAIKEEVLPIEDVSYHILKMLDKYYPSLLNERYGIEKLDEDVITNLEIIGTKRGCLMRGGVVDYDKVYNVIINDLKTGIIKGITFDRI